MDLIHNNMSFYDIYDEYYKLKNRKSEICLSNVGISILDYYFLNERFNTPTVNKCSVLSYLQNNREQVERYMTAYNCSIKSLIGLKCSPCYHFRPIIAKYIYDLLKPKTVCDPFMGWGARFLAAMALNMKYIGFETNTNLQMGYESMAATLCFPIQKFQFNWINCLDFDYSSIEYDLVFTSPPYINDAGQLIEKYNNMPIYSDFYTDFYIPLLKKLFDHLQPNGHIVLNIPTNMLPKSSELLGEPIQTLPYPKRKSYIRTTGITKDEFIYIWKKI